MKIKFRVQTLDEVPEALRPLYTEQNGEFVLAVDGLEDTSGLKNALASEKEERRRAKEQLAALKAAIGDMDPEEAKAALSKVREMEDKALLDQGKVDELLAKRTEEMRRTYEGQIKSLQAQAKEYEDKLGATTGQLNDYVLGGSVKEAALKMGVRPEALDLLTLQAKGVWKVEDGSLVAYDNQGQVRYGKNGANPLTVDEWLESERASRPFLFQETRGGGAAGGANGRPGQKRVISRDDHAALSASLEDIASGKAVVE